MLQALLSKLSVREISTLLRMHMQHIQWMVECIPLVIKVRQMNFSSEIGSSNVEYFSLQGNTTHSQKMKKGQWDIRRKFKFDCLLRYPFTEPIPLTNENETS